MDRFIILDKSDSKHCCFNYTIIDTAAGKDNIGVWVRSMCECFEEAEAHDICNALNAMESKPDKVNRSLTGGRQKK